MRRTFSDNTVSRALLHLKQEGRDLNWDGKRNRNSYGKGIGALHVSAEGVLAPSLATMRVNVISGHPDRAFFCRRALFLDYLRHPFAQTDASGRRIKNDLRAGMIPTRDINRR
jgi:hypothetical protein